MTNNRLEQQQSEFAPQPATRNGQSTIHPRNSCLKRWPWTRAQIPFTFTKSNRVLYTKNQTLSIIYFHVQNSPRHSKPRTKNRPSIANQVQETLTLTVTLTLTLTLILILALTLTLIWTLIVTLTLTLTLTLTATQVQHQKPKTRNHTYISSHSSSVTSCSACLPDLADPKNIQRCRYPQQRPLCCCLTSCVWQTVWRLYLGDTYLEGGESQ